MKMGVYRFSLTTKAKAYIIQSFLTNSINIIYRNKYNMHVRKRDQARQMSVVASHTNALRYCASATGRSNYPLRRTIFRVCRCTGCIPLTDSPFPDKLLLAMHACTRTRRKPLKPQKGIRVRISHLFSRYYL